MKKIIIVAQLKGIGGVEQSLINLLKSFPQGDVMVTVAFLEGNNSIRAEIPPYIKQINIDRIDDKRHMVRLLKAGHLLDAVKVGINYLCNRMLSTVSYKSLAYKTERYADIPDQYDYAISWAMPDAFENIFTLKKVKADKKVMLVHMDLRHYLMPKDSIFYLNRFDHFYCVSAACKQSFCDSFPEYLAKTDVFYNVINAANILKLAGAEPSCIRGKDEFAIVSCGRLAKEKRPLQAVDLCAELIRQGYCNIRWYWIGDGALYQQVAERVKEKGVENSFVLLGVKNNPYPYMSDADLYVQLSHHESFCLTLAEALILGVPVVSTNFKAAYEIVDDCRNGIIVKQDFDSILDAIKKMITDDKLRAKMREGAKNTEISKFSSTGKDFLEILGKEG